MLIMITMKSGAGFIKAWEHYPTLRNSNPSEAMRGEIGRGGRHASLMIPKRMRKVET